MVKQNASPVIARIFVDEALNSGRAAGVDLDALLRDLAIAPAMLDALTPMDFARIWLELSLRMEDEFFGLGKRPMRPGSTTLLGHAVHNAATLGIALRRALRFLKVVLDEPYGDLRTQKSLCVITLQDQDGPRSAFAYRTFFLILHGFSCWLARERIPLTYVKFPCDAPLTTNDYQDFFGVPVEFQAPQAQLAFDRRFLSRPVQRSEADLKRFLRTTPEAFLRGYRDTGSLRHALIERFFSGPPKDWPDMREIARRSGVSRSTLYRQLQSQGQSLAQIKDDLRRNRATALLNTSNLTIAEISHELGYAEESAFYRAFRKWHGTTPRRV